jgi:hypothetical protein
MITDEIIWELRKFIVEHYKIQGEYHTDKLLGLISDNNTDKMIADFKEVVDGMIQYINVHRNRYVFSKLLEKYKNEKGISNTDLYDQAMISRQLYSKIVSELYYHPDKNTVIALGLGLRLTREKMDKLLASAGYALSNCIMSDLVIMFCIEKKYSILMM